MKRVVVIGCPGSGKTTFAEGLHRVSGLPLYYLDAIWHKADRTHVTREEFDTRLAKILAKDAFIIDGHYSRTVERRIAAADTVFLFDLPTEVCLAGAIARLGKKRPDMPFCDTVLDERFKTEIEEFRERCLPTLYTLLHTYREGREVIIFKTREEADRYLLRHTADR